MSPECDFTRYHKLRSWAFVDSVSYYPSITKIKEAIYNFGPVCSAVYVGQAFHAYTGGLFNACEDGVPNHAVVLVGWDDRLGAKGAWIMRNSWGRDWGYEGYMYIEYGCSLIGYRACYGVYDNPPPEPSGVPYLMVSPSAQTVASDSGSVSFLVENTQDGTMNWTTAVSGESASWLRIQSGNTGNNRGTIQVSYDANGLEISRSGKITISAPGALNSPFVVSIEQAGRANPVWRYLAAYDFQGNLQDRASDHLPFVANNVIITPEWLELNGKYGWEWEPLQGYRAMTPLLPELDYRCFAFELECYLDEAKCHEEHLARCGNLRELPILVGGDFYRWFSVFVTPDYNVGFSLNNGDFEHIFDVKVEPYDWLYIDATVDLYEGKVVIGIERYDPEFQEFTYYFGSSVELRVVEDGSEYDKFFTLTNYGKGLAFAGRLNFLEITTTVR